MCGKSSHLGICILAEAEKKREAKQRAREAQERELRKREKAEEKERRRKEYDALKASKREQEKKPKKETNQAPSKFSLRSKVVFRHGGGPKLAHLGQTVNPLPRPGTTSAGLPTGNVGLS